MQKRKRPVYEVPSDEDGASDDEAELEALALAEIQAEQDADNQMEGDSDNDEDDDEEEEDEEDEDQLNNAASRITALSNAVSELKSDLPWIELFDISSKSITIANPEDDLARETLFYSATLQAVKEARKMLEAEGVPHRRPEDFFAEMVKSDNHMKKIKESLVFEKQKMEAYASRRSEQDQRKFAKKVQAAKLKEKNEAKREHENSVSKWRENNKGAGKDDLAGDFNKHFLGKDGSKTPNKNKKRESKDKKFGMLGKPARFQKKNDAKSSADMRDFKPFRKGGSNSGSKGSPASTHSRGRTKAKKPNRPGKEARNAKRQRTQ